jgi:acetyl/propionyl-CoA carboxylase alpha subunit
MMQWFVTIQEKKHLVTSPPRIVADTTFPVEIDGIAKSVRWQPTSQNLFISETNEFGTVDRRIGFRSYVQQYLEDQGEFHFECELTGLGIHIGNGTLGPFVQGQESRKSKQTTGQANIRSNLTGKVLKIFVEPGTVVTRGDPLLIVEAMKMENRVDAERAGTVKKIGIKLGDKVSVGQLLVVIE